MRGILRTTLINLLVIAALVLTLELGYRIVKLAGSCFSSTCDVDYLTPGNKFLSNVEIGISRDDPVLGHVPNDGDYEVPWLNRTPIPVTIRDSVRLNGTPADTVFQSDHLSLAIGDSFTFGDQVRDSDTWPACLEREWNTRVVNGGVYGYGGAQAVLRAQELERRAEFDRVIWSILLGHDFERDELVSRSSSARPAVISTPQGLRFTTVEESQDVLDSVAEKGIAKYANLFGYLYVTKLAWRHFSPYMLPPGARYDGRWSVPHPRAASRPELMAFAFDEFVELEAPEKYVLLQYPLGSTEKLSPADSAEADAVRQLAAERQIEVIDTLPVLRAAPDPKALYQPHHTPAGNRVVCESIVAAIADGSDDVPLTQGAQAARVRD